MKNANSTTSRSVSATYLIPQAHWDAMADILGEEETVRLYGARPELHNTATSVERLYFNDRAPKRALWVVLLLTVVLVGSVLWAATNRAERATIEPCALVLTHSGSECR